MLLILTAGLISLIITFVGTRFWINFLKRRSYGQFVRDDGPTAHHVKRGTPTMGGVFIIFAVVVTYGLSHLIFQSPVSVSGLLVLGLAVGLGAVGFIDDWLKISNARSLGLTAPAKLALQITVGAAFAIAALNFPDDRGVTPASDFISFLRDLPMFHLPFIVAVLWIMFLIAAFSNGTNLTDGLDGLLTGSAVMVFIAYAVINIWQANQWCGAASTAGPKCYEVRNPLDLAVLAVAFAGALFGFLWWNARPAKIFLGDTGSLAIGGAVAAMTIFTRTELLGAVIGLVFVLESVSVIAQVGFFKLTGGRRILRMAPLHHHFEMIGWEEVTVVIRFWIISGVAVLAGAGLFYAEWVVGQG
ncbi:MAG: phospho-N-acetylmuramoyl-pentapeptide-transferase [Propionibacteriaceae bacterium]|jgi:phospho-N-acetylmuramoyl-pentapeptide-transferase|nr:phospho-N-acetylmuramoyl-pentapeptide-transferase [Propionibacteriaceae bacterium]